jgi:hypothetical protein
MDHNETAFYNQAITLAKMGHREQAYSYFKRISFNNPNDQDVVFWQAYTAPSLEKAQELLDQAHFLNPESPVLRQANQWLTNEKLHLPQPAEGYSLFPPANHQAQVMPLPYASTQALTPYYSGPPAAPYYPPQQIVPYQPLPTYQPYAGPVYRPPYPAQFYPGAFPAYVQPYYRPVQALPWSYPNQNYPPVRWNNLPSYAGFLALGSYRCPYCNSPYPPVSQRRISTSGWITFAVLVAVFFPVAWVGLLMQENYLRCSQCRLVLT